MLLIDKNALHKKICSACAERLECIEHGNICFEVSCIENAPTIEAEPVRHGYWIECDYKHLEHGMIETELNAGLCCSECRAAFQKKKMTYKQYCAACGARMDADETAMQRAAADDYAEF